MEVYKVLGEWPDETITPPSTCIDGDIVNAWPTSEQIVGRELQGTDATRMLLRDGYAVVLPPDLMSDAWGYAGDSIARRYVVKRVRDDPNSYYVNPPKP